ncbi:imidazole glycerol phosphate synthase subunit HisH [Nitratifractor sp.]
MIGVVDYRMGNLGSVLNAFAKVGAQAELVSDPERIQKYERLVLPGVGAFPDAMSHLRSSGMDEAIRSFAASGQPLMGTCLGMQLLFEASEEFGEHEGLGLIPGRVVRFDETKFDHPLKVPHMGWNELFVGRIEASEGWTDAEGRSRIFEGLPDEFYLYFVHSYHAVTEDRYVIGRSYYGYEFVSAVQRENVIGFQPHPEKSHDHGLKIIENFTKL